MLRRSKFQFGTNTFTCSLPARPWTPGDSTVGGTKVSAAGVPASYVVRRDALLDVPLRFDESEYELLLAMVAWGQGGLPITWTPDAEDGALGSFDVYLEAPAPGTSWKPTRAADYARMFEFTITLRAQAGMLAPYYFD